MAFTLGILETGRLADDLAKRFAAYPQMFETLLRPVDGSLEFKSFAVLDDVFPASVTACDGWLITGSRFGVYDNLPWMARLQDFLRAAYAAEVPIVGICFGHQILASALGGRVEKSSRGWGVGPHSYQIATPKPWMGDTKSITLNAMHQDQVVAVPDGTEVLAASEFCPYAALSYNDRAISFQPHPEFANDVERAILAQRRESGVVPLAVADPALAKIDAPDSAAKLDAAKIATWIVDFLKYRTAIG